MQTIASVEELDALPNGTILLTAGQNPIQKNWVTGEWWLPDKPRPMPTHLMIGFRVLHIPDPT
jgi:hypothetical protein